MFWKKWGGWYCTPLLLKEGGEGNRVATQSNIGPLLFNFRERTARVKLELTDFSVVARLQVSALLLLFYNFAYIERLYFL